MTPERLHRADATLLAALSDLCLRSKAHWGYDPALLERWRPALTVHATDLNDEFAIVRSGPQLMGFAHLILDSDVAQLDKLFVDPAHLRKGVGQALFDWCCAQSRNAKARQMVVESDPSAEGFYIQMGARPIGRAPSEPPKGRTLPVLALAL